MSLEGPLHKSSDSSLESLSMFIRNVFHFTMKKPRKHAALKSNEVVTHEVKVHKF